MPQSVAQDEPQGINSFGSNDSNGDGFTLDNGLDTYYPVSIPSQQQAATPKGVTSPMQLRTPGPGLVFHTPRPGLVLHTPGPRLSESEGGKNLPLILAQSKEQTKQAVATAIQDSHKATIQTLSNLVNHAQDGGTIQVGTNQVGTSSKVRAILPETPGGLDTTIGNGLPGLLVAAVAKGLYWALSSLWFYSLCFLKFSGKNAFHYFKEFWIATLHYVKALWNTIVTKISGGDKGEDGGQEEIVVEDEE